ncbi:apolipoprotein D and lipocalin family protein [Marinobacterium halophilum]|uniref:Outer membrane lipoprotein Blc n=1 Tax=Marinobacterium halophilum TaxID=267374 RepID=A0A2P8ERW3_9GAMM|nr:lipocalin family protein [Marinobacterium halophilum]PSL12229.1 apolipoprotein D and lipocalin family protein [Marinobacterium halophilum]
MRTTLFALMLLALTACTGLPDRVEPVQNFQLDRYLGTWYEIARLDHSFERGLSQVQADYSLRDDGGVKVINRGYDAKKGEWREAEGKAYFVDDADTGHLKVSFFGPFYGAYVIMALDHDGYQYSLVSGPDRDYLWILSRTPTMDTETLNRLIDQAREAGYPVDELIFMEHE